MSRFKNKEQKHGSGDLRIAIADRYNSTTAMFSQEKCTQIHDVSGRYRDPLPSIPTPALTDQIHVLMDVLSC